MLKKDKKADASKTLTLTVKVFFWDEGKIMRNRRTGAKKVIGLIIHNKKILKEYGGPASEYLIHGVRRTKNHTKKIENIAIFKAKMKKIKS